MRYDIEVDPSKPRIREYLLGLACCALLVAYLDSGNLGAQIVDERQQHLASCQRDRENAERYARVLAHAFNGGAIQVEGATRANCRAYPIPEKS